MLLVLFGVGLSIPIVIWGSGLLARLMGRFPWIVTLGAAILGYVGGEMMLKDRVVHRWLGEGLVAYLHWLVPVALAGLVVLVGMVIKGRRPAPTHSPSRG
jgi:predicted tellurium resistance membrane protein TerC